MKAINIQQPFASLVVNGAKDIENRTWRPPLKKGEPLLILSSKKWSDEFPRGQGVADYYRRMKVQQVPDVFPLGGVVGIVWFAGVSTNSGSKWAMEGCYHWHLRNAMPLPFVPHKGQLGIYRVELKSLPYDLELKKRIQ